MNNQSLLDYQFIDEIVAYGLSNDNLIMRKKYPKKVGDSDKIIWQQEEETAIQFLGALSQPNFLKLKNYIYQNCEYIVSPFKELWIKNDIEIEGLEKKIKKDYYIIGRLPEDREFKLWISNQITEIKPAYEKPTLERTS